MYFLSARTTRTRSVAIVRAERDQFVLALIRACLPRIPRVGLHGRKVWISAVLDQILADGHDFNREALRESIVFLGRLGFFRLTRCDLPQLHRQVLVDRSRTFDGPAEFHFLELF